MEIKRNKVSSILLAISMVLILAGAVLPFFHLKLDTSRWILAAGAAMALIARFLEPVISQHESLRLSRLQRMDKVTAVIFCISASCLFFKEKPEIYTAWVPLLMAAAVLQIYTTLMTERELKKTAKDNANNTEKTSKKKKNSKKR